MTHDAVREDDALAGLALRAVLAVLPQQAQLIVRLDRDARRAAIESHLGYLAERNVLSSADVEALRRQLNGEARTGGPATDSPSEGGHGGSLTLKAVLGAAVSAEPATDSFLDTLWDAAVTIV